MLPHHWILLNFNNEQDRLHTIDVLPFCSSEIFFSHFLCIMLSSVCVFILRGCLNNTVCCHSWWQTSAILPRNSLQPIALCSRLCSSHTNMAELHMLLKKIKAWTTHIPLPDTDLIEDLWGRMSRLLNNSSSLIDEGKWLKMSWCSFKVEDFAGTNSLGLHGMKQPQPHTALHKWEGCNLDEAAVMQSCRGAQSALTAAPMLGHYGDASVAADNYRKDQY